MARLREFAGRFRPAGVPGAAAPAGVPADLRADREAELEPVFAALAETVRACSDLREQAAADARETERRARERCGSILADARSRTAAARADASALARGRTIAENQALLDQARHTAQTIRERARTRLPHLVEQVLDRIRALGAGP
ncbi:hypothetical protein MF672_031695 [Actinomadura sp. ATCC 31491]|uniref:ATPase n=1 Tax=Actinomadura luzonensis TaxID=2805427 RepID=A0ABT0G139_9ACTN|nr:hypothetical protein [Actinomadura luzonensis]MCK2218322.1 hypothetical protein [Actinomadura luzonensis]